MMKLTLIAATLAGSLTPSSCSQKPQDDESAMPTPVSHVHYFGTGSYRDCAILAKTPAEWSECRAMKCEEQNLWMSDYVFDPKHRSDEVRPWQYSLLARAAQCEPQMRPLISKAFSDRKVTNAEYIDLANQESEQIQQRELAQAKNSLVANLGRGK